MINKKIAILGAFMALYGMVVRADKRGLNSFRVQFIQQDSNKPNSERGRTQTFETRTLNSPLELMRTNNLTESIGGILQNPQQKGKKELTEKELQRQISDNLKQYNQNSNQQFNDALTRVKTPEGLKQIQGAMDLPNSVDDSFDLLRETAGKLSNSLSVQTRAPIDLPTQDYLSNIRISLPSGMIFNDNVSSARPFGSDNLIQASQSLILGDRGDSNDNKK